ncbi:hypothetical protein [Burkholderia ubonensis]|uniref:hypothetical protein n=1 Tax=Burkholderia ubonensis TaxID=101571 RepID=UPI000757BE7A|nr:hypothetical protein [Burkholderia ubonensis]KVW77429.1 hypothetical protein WK99_27940 [Burkholderia ubonensis]
MTKINLAALLDGQQTISKSNAPIDEKLQRLRELQSQFEMRIDDLIASLNEIRARKGNIRVLRPNQEDQNISMQPVDMHLRMLDDGEFVLTLNDGVC